MKTSIKIMLMLLVAAGMLTFASCTKEKQLPESITVSGQVTDEAGQPFEGVSISVSKSTFMSLIIPVTGTTTDENGFYRVEFEPDADETFTMSYDVDKDGYHYKAYYGVDKWKAVQEHDVVLIKTTE